LRGVRRGEEGNHFNETAIDQKGENMFWMMSLMSLLLIGTECAEVRVEGADMCLALYMLNGAPGTPSSLAKEKARLNAAVSGKSLLQMNEKSRISSSSPSFISTATSFLESMQSTVKSHMANCMSMQTFKNGAVKPCSKALPPAITLIKSYVKSEASTWFKSECDELLDRVTSKASFNSFDFLVGSEQRKVLTSCGLESVYNECHKALEGMNEYLMERDEAIRLILSMNIDKMSDDEKRKKQVWCREKFGHSESGTEGKFSQQDIAVSLLWKSCDDEMAKLRKRLSNAATQRNGVYKYGLYSVLKLDTKATAEQIDTACDGDSNFVLQPSLVEESNLLTTTEKDNSHIYEITKKQKQHDILEACTRLQNVDEKKRYDIEYIHNVDLYNTLVEPEERSYVCEPMIKTCDDVELPYLNIETEECEECPNEKPIWDSQEEECVTKIIPNDIVKPIQCTGDQITNPKNPTECMCPEDRPKLIHENFKCCPLDTEWNVEQSKCIKPKLCEF
jgi:hypothetical protein